MIAFFFLVAWLDSPLHLTGVVVDPQELPVPGAAVGLACGRSLLETRTNGDGKFAFERVVTTEECSLSVVHEGFESYVARVGESTRAITITLRVARVREAVHVAAPVPDAAFEPIGSLRFGTDELTRISDRTADIIRAAVLSAGGTTVGTAVYVDGLPGSVLPPPDMIAQLDVNANPFSAEYGDGDVNRVQIVTKGLGRRFRVAPGASVLGFGGGDSLRRGSASQNRGATLAISGPVPRLPITLASNVRFTRTSDEVAVEAVVPAGRVLGTPGKAPSDRATVSNQIWTMNLTGHYVSARGLQAHAAYSGMQSDSSNVGVGGLVLPEAGLSSRSSTHNVHASTRVTRAALLHEGGVVLRSAASETRANSSAPGVSVAGYFVAGGAPMAVQDSLRLAWTAKYVLRSSSARPWATGIVVSRSSQDQTVVPNAYGTLEFDGLDGYARAIAGEPRATWFGARAEGRAQYRGVTVAPFFQATLVRSSRALIQGGVRADSQSGVGTLVSPRIWTATVLGGFSVQAGGGLFVESIPDGVFMKARMDEEGQFQQQVATGVGIDDPRGGASASLIRTRLSPSLAAPRHLVQRAAVERPLGGFVPSMEYTWARSFSRLGSDRFALGEQWIDVIDSNRAAVRHRLLGRLRYRWRSQTVAAHYEWVRAADDGDGPYSYPARSGDIASEWARSSAFAPHNAGVSGSFALPASIYMTVTGMWQHSLPYNVTTGVDADRNGLFTERGGLARNSGNAPGQRLMTLYATRRFDMAKWLRRSKDRVFLTTGAQLENVLDAKNVTASGSVVGAPTFGRPVAALPGRSLRFWINIG